MNQRIEDASEAGPGDIVQNDVATGRQIDTPLAHARSPTVHGAIVTLDLESTRRDLIAMRGMIHLTTDCSKAPIGQASAEIVSTDGER